MSATNNLQVNYSCCTIILLHSPPPSNKNPGSAPEYAHKKSIFFQQPQFNIILHYFVLSICCLTKLMHHGGFSFWPIQSDIRGHIFVPRKFYIYIHICAIRVDMDIDIYQYLVHIQASVYHHIPRPFFTHVHTEVTSRNRMTQGNTGQLLRATR